MATWTVTAQLTTGTLVLGPTDRIWFTGALFTNTVTVGQYQTTTHVSDSSDVHLCTTNHVHNTKFLTSSTVSLNGGASAAVSTITTGQCPLKFAFTDTASIATTNAKFYAYDGASDASPVPNITFVAFEQGDTAWVGANGSTAALSLNDQTAATTHNFYIGISSSPTTTGDKTGKFKLSLTFI